MKQGKIDFQTYLVLLSGNKHADSEASPHAQESNRLPRCMNVPLSNQGHQAGAKRIQDDKND